MVYDPLYYAWEIASIKLSSRYSYKAKSARFSNISWLFLRKLLFHSQMRQSDTYKLANSMQIQTAFLSSLLNLRLHLFSPETTQNSLCSASENIHPSISHFCVEARVNKHVHTSVSVRHKHCYLDNGERSARGTAQQTDDVNHCNWRCQKHEDTDDDHNNLCGPTLFTLHAGSRHVRSGVSRVAIGRWSDVDGSDWWLLLQNPATVSIDAKYLTNLPSCSFEDEIVGECEDYYHG